MATQGTDGKKKDAAAKATVKPAAEKSAAPVAQAAGEAAPATEKERNQRRKLVGEVTSDKMDKTVVVRVTHRVRSQAYLKYMTKRVKYKAHDEKNEYKTGDRVEISESRPMSRDKRWRVTRLVERARDAVQVNA